ncbi:MAG: GCN5-related N-acetyltransferase, partial [Herbinix sp.]|nr:GCN5-related N-acetyltransferase [Herbinix sp.]
MEIIYREIHVNELDDNMLKNFNRYQNVLKDWCYENGEYVLKSSPHIEIWDESAKKRKIKTFFTILQHNGKLFGAYDNDKLIGFSGIDGILIGSRNQYIELSELHVSYEYRGKKIGKELF